MNGAGTVGPASDPPLIVNGGWQAFSFGGTGTFDFQGPYTYTSTGYTEVKVTDAFLDGDQFAVYDNSVLLGDTSVPANDGASQPDPNAAYTDPRFSHGAFDLAPGSHSITIQAIQSPYGGGGAYLRAYDIATPGGGSTAPLPSSAYGGMALLGLLGAYKLRRRMTAGNAVA